MCTLPFKSLESKCNNDDDLGFDSKPLNGSVSVNKIWNSKRMNWLMSDWPTDSFICEH